RAPPHERCGAERCDDCRVHDDEARLPAEGESTNGADPEEGVPPRPLTRRLPDDRRYDCGERRGRGTAPRRRAARSTDEHTPGARAGEQHRDRGEKERNLPDQPERGADTIAGWP